MAHQTVTPSALPGASATGLGRACSRRHLLRLAVLGAGGAAAASLLSACDSPIGGQPSIRDRLPPAAPGETIAPAAPAIAQSTPTRPAELTRPATPTDLPRPISTPTRPATSTPVSVIRPIAPGTGVTPRRAI